MIHQEQFSLISTTSKTICGDLTYDDKNTNVPVVIFVHGFKGFKDWGTHNLVARFFVQNGFRYLKFNFSYAGVTEDNLNDVTDLESFASNTFSKEIQDIDVIINHALKYLGTTEIYLIGHSRGGGLSILEAANNPAIKGLITWSSISAFNSLWKKEQEEQWKKEGKIFVENARTKEKMPLNVTLLQDFEDNKEQLNIIEAAKKINIPWLIIQGDDDVNVPFENAQQLANANPNSRLIKIEGANHVYGASHPFNNDTLPQHLFQVCEKSLMFLNSLS